MHNACFAIIAMFHYYKEAGKLGEKNVPFGRVTPPLLLLRASLKIADF
jgi:hypothetical protein